MQPSMKNSASDRQLGYLRSLVCRYPCYEEYSVRTEECTSMQWRLPTVFVVLPCQVSILNSFSELSKTSLWYSSQLFHSAVGFLFVHLSLDGRRWQLATFEIVSRGCGYVRAISGSQWRHTIKSLLPQQNAIPGKHHSFIALVLLLVLRTHNDTRQ